MAAEIAAVQSSPVRSVRLPFQVSHFCFGLWVSGAGFRVEGFRVQGSGVRVRVLVSGFRFQVCRTSALARGFRVPGFGFRV